MGFRKRVVLWLVGCVCVGVAVSCGRLGKGRPSREAVEPLLRQEAEDLKRDGEKVDPSLGVKIIWEIQSVEVREQANDESQPWTGTIRFVITSEQPEYGGRVATDTFDKQFDYVWDSTSERWIMK